MPETTKKCRSCQEDIPTKAKVCSKCKAKQGNWFQRHMIITVILGLILIMIISGAAGGGSKNTPTTSNTTNNSVASDTKTPQNQPTSYKVGETFSPDNKVEITVVSMQEKNQVGSQYFESKPAEGGTYVAIDWKYKNISDAPIGSFSTPTVKLVSPTGVQYDSDLSASSYYATEKKLDGKVLSDLNPGISVNDAKVFEVSKDLFSQPGWQLLIKNVGKDIRVSLN